LLWTLAGSPAKAVQAGDALVVVRVNLRLRSTRQDLGGGGATGTGAMFSTVQSYSSAHPCAHCCAALRQLGASSDGASRGGGLSAVWWSTGARALKLGGVFSGSSSGSGWEGLRSDRRTANPHTGLCPLPGFAPPSGAAEVSVEGKLHIAVR
jgi:hypothetical protein